MKRPWLIWFWFGLCLAIMLAAIGWVTRTTLALDRLQWEAEAQAQLEEKVRLGLWLMDSRLLPLFIEESARPPAIYQAFLRAGPEGKTKNPDAAQSKFTPSPLLTHTSALVIVHFDFVPGQRPTSPQVPEGYLRTLAANGNLTSGRMDEYARRLANLQAFLQSGASAQLKGSLVVNDVALLNELPATAEANGSQNQVYANAAPAQSQSDAIGAQQPGLNAQPEQQAKVNESLAVNNLSNQKRSQYLRNADEFNQRGNVYQMVQSAAVVNYLNGMASAPLDNGNPEAAHLPFKAVWVQGQLFLARRVMLDGQTHVQGCWLNWENIKASLLESISDVLPGAELQPLPAGDTSAAGRMLAALPVKVVPPAINIGAGARVSPVRALLVTAWMGILLAALAAAFLLHGTISLSERRAAFVSSVTHELRTPLTTFKMYSEMLADGMVTDPEQQRQYLATLCAESTRLTHLVENVLAYARLERGSARRVQEKMALCDLIQRVEPRLRQRAVQAGLALQVDADDRALSRVVQVDAVAVEQILFNLVDNACKYAAPSAVEKVIHLEAISPAERGRHAMLRVRDHGQGISAEAARRLFQPFGKTAQDAAHSAPGVGLGLALCRRLSRALGGDLHWIPSVKEGACFELRLPVAAETS